MCHSLKERAQGWILGLEGGHEPWQGKKQGS